MTECRYKDDCKEYSVNFYCCQNEEAYCASRKKFERVTKEEPLPSKVKDINSPPPPTSDEKTPHPLSSPSPIKGASSSSPPPQATGIGETKYPPDISQYLASDEKIVKFGKDKEWEVYVTDKRVIFKKGAGGIWGKEIIEASYRHISSIEYKKDSTLDKIGRGTVLLILAFVFYYIGMPLSQFFMYIAIILFFIGLILILGAFGGNTPLYKIHVVGRKPLLISGELEGIIRIIRQYREKVETSGKNLMRAHKMFNALACRD